MNQILDYNPNKSSGGGSSGSDKIVRVFAILLIIFAICLLGSGAYGLYKKNSEKTKPVATQTKAQISVEQEETTGIIKVSHDKAIEKLIYSWDNEKEINNKGNGESTMEVEIALIAGEHTLNIKVVDIDGVESTYEEVIISENGEDKIYPVITLDVDNVTKKLVITVTDETALDFVTYRWNNEEEQRIDVDEDEKKIEFDIEILKGQNDLTIVAVDKNNNTTTEQKNLKGVTKPDVKITVAADKKSADVYCYHENGIEGINVKLNDISQDVPLEEAGAKEAGFQITLVEGENDITVTATSVDGTETIANEVVKNEPDAETNIEIMFEEIEGVSDKILVKAVSENGIKEMNIDVNDAHFDVPLPGVLQEAPVEVPIVEGTNNITVRIVTEDGTEKTETKEVTR